MSVVSVGFAMVTRTCRRVVRVKCHSLVVPFIFSINKEEVLIVPVNRQVGSHNGAAVLVWNIIAHPSSYLLDQDVLLKFHWLKSLLERAHSGSWTYYFLITLSQLLFPIFILTQYVSFANNGSPAGRRWVAAHKATESWKGSANI